MTAVYRAFNTMLANETYVLFYGWLEIIDSEVKIPNTVLGFSDDNDGGGMFIPLAMYPLKTPTSVGSFEV